MATEFAVIGLGVFGHRVAVSLTRLGHSVLAIDVDEERVRRLAEELDTVVRGDATDEGVLRELQLDRVSCVVVAMGADSAEASILTTTLLRQIGVPQIVARSLSSLHARVLRAVGAHEVVNPEEEMGERLARRLSQPFVFGRIDLGTDVQVAEMKVPSDFVDKSLADLDVRRRFGISVVAVRRGSDVLAPLDAAEVLQGEDVLVVIGTTKAIGRVASRA